MSRSETEQCVLFLRSLAQVIDEAHLFDYEQEYLDSAGDRKAAVKQLERAAQAVELLYQLGEWLRVEM